MRGHCFPFRARPLRSALPLVHSHRGRCRARHCTPRPDGEAPHSRASPRLRRPGRRSSVPAVTRSARLLRRGTSSGVLGRQHRVREGMSGLSSWNAGKWGAQQARRGRRLCGDAAWRAQPADREHDRELSAEELLRRGRPVPSDRAAAAIRCGPAARRFCPRRRARQSASVRPRRRRHARIHAIGDARFAVAERKRDAVDDGLLLLVRLDTLHRHDQQARFRGRGAAPAA